MICKLIVHDENREAALSKLVDSLEKYQIAGVPTNIEFLVKCAQHETFQEAGAVNTGFLDDHLEDVQVRETNTTRPLAAAVGAFVSMLHLENRFGVENLNQSRQSSSPWTSLAGSWRNEGLASRDLELQDGTKIQCACHRDGSYDIRIGPDETFHISGTISNEGDMHILVNNTKRISIQSAFHDKDDIFEIRMWPDNEEDYFWQVDVQNPLIPTFATTQTVIMGQGSVKAPMPGKISRINAKVGDIVGEGDVLVVMEAMKMEHTILSPISGALTELKYQVDDIVQDGAVLAVVESDDVYSDSESSEAV